jgi:hypothetical protein
MKAKECLRWSWEKNNQPRRRLATRRIAETTREENRHREKTIPAVRARLKNRKGKAMV